MHQIYFDIILEVCRYLSCKEIVGLLNCSTQLRKHRDKVLAQIIKHRFHQYEVNIDDLITRNKNLITLYNVLYNKYINGPHGVIGLHGEIGTCNKSNWGGNGNNNGDTQDKKTKYTKVKKNYMITRNRLTRGNRIKK